MARGATVLQMRMTNGEINRLSDRLRTAEDDGQRRISSGFRSFAGSMRRRFTRLRRVLSQPFPTSRSPTSRFKTVQTLVGKLRREEHMNLSQVQDIAGIRIVREMTIASKQNRDTFASLFDASKTIDRRAKPSFGYRAVHVVAKVDGLLVEIQVRTALQDRWAQILSVRRTIGGVRSGTARPPAGCRAGRAGRPDSIVRLVRRLSPLIESCEQASTSARHAQGPWRPLLRRGDGSCADRKVPVLGSAS